MRATRFPLLILIALCAMTLAATPTLTAQPKTFRGEWFTVEYPANFTAEGSLPSATSNEDEAFDSATFTSPDGSVTFYVYSPQWSGDPTDIELSENEREGQRKVTHGKRQTVTYWTIGAKDGSYTRSYQEVREDETMHVLGIHYTTQQAYNKYKKQYLQSHAHSQLNSRGGRPPDARETVRCTRPPLSPPNPITRTQTHKQINA